MESCTCLIDYHEKAFRINTSMFSGIFDDFEDEFRTLAKDIGIPDDFLKVKKVNDIFTSMKTRLTAFFKMKDPGQKTESGETSSKFSYKGNEENERGKLEVLKKRCLDIWNEAKERRSASSSVIMQEAIRLAKGIDQVIHEEIHDLYIARFENAIRNLEESLKNEHCMDKNENEMFQEISSDYTRLIEIRDQLYKASDFSLISEAKQFSAATRASIQEIDCLTKNLNSQLNTIEPIHEDIAWLNRHIEYNIKRSLWDRVMKCLKILASPDGQKNRNREIQALSGMPVLSKELLSQLAFNSSDTAAINPLIRKAVKEMSNMNTDQILTEYNEEMNGWLSNRVENSLHAILSLCRREEWSMLEPSQILNVLKQGRKLLYDTIQMSNYQGASIGLSFGCSRLTIEDVIVYFSNDPVAVLNSRLFECSDLSPTKNESSTSISAACYQTEGIYSVPVFGNNRMRVDSAVHHLVRFLDDYCNSPNSHRGLAFDKAVKEAAISTYFLLFPLVLIRNDLSHIAKYIQLSPDDDAQRRITVLNNNLERMRIDVDGYKQKLEDIGTDLFKTAANSDEEQKRILKQRIDETEQRIVEVAIDVEAAKKELLIRQRNLYLQLSTNSFNLINDGAQILSKLLGCHRLFIGAKTEDIIWGNVNVLQSHSDDIVTSIKKRLEQEQDQSVLLQMQKPVKDWVDRIGTFCDTDLGLLSSHDVLRKCLSAICTAASVGLQNVFLMLMDGVYTQSPPDLGEEKIASHAIELINSCSSNDSEQNNIMDKFQSLLDFKSDLSLHCPSENERTQSDFITYTDHLITTTINQCFSFANKQSPIDMQTAPAALQKHLEEGIIEMTSSAEEDDLKKGIDGLSNEWNSWEVAYRETSRHKTTSNPYQLLWTIDNAISSCSVYRPLSVIATTFTWESINLWKQLVEALTDGDHLPVAESDSYKELIEKLMSITDIKLTTMESSNEIHEGFSTLTETLSSWMESVFHSRTNPLPFMSDYMLKMCDIWYFETMSCCIRNYQQSSKKPAAVEPLKTRMSETESNFKHSANLLQLNDFIDIDHLKDQLYELEATAVLERVRKGDIRELHLTAQLVKQFDCSVVEKLLNEWRKYSAFEFADEHIETYKDLLDAYWKLMGTDIQTILKNGCEFDSDLSKQLERVSLFNILINQDVYKEMCAWMNACHSNVEGLIKEMKMISDEMDSTAMSFDTKVDSFAETLCKRRNKDHDVWSQEISKIKSQITDKQTDLDDLVHDICQNFLKHWFRVREKHSKGLPDLEWCTEELTGIPSLSNKLSKVHRKYQSLDDEYKTIFSLEGIHRRVYSIEVVSIDVAPFLSSHENSIELSCDGGGSGRPLSLNQATDTSSLLPYTFKVDEEEDFKLTFKAKKGDQCMSEKSFFLEQLSEFKRFHLLGRREKEKHGKFGLKVLKNVVYTPKEDDISRVPDDSTEEAEFEEYSRNVDKAYDQFFDQASKLEELMEGLKKAETNERAHVIDSVKIKEEKRLLRGSRPSIAVRQMKASVKDIKRVTTESLNERALRYETWKDRKATETMEIARKLSAAIKESPVEVRVDDMTIFSEYGIDHDMSGVWTPSMKEAFAKVRDIHAEYLSRAKEVLEDVAVTSVCRLVICFLDSTSQTRYSKLETTQEELMSALSRLNLVPERKEMLKLKSRRQLDASRLLGKSGLHWIERFNALSQRLKTADEMPDQTDSILSGTRLLHLTRLTITESSERTYQLSEDGENVIDFGTLLHQADAMTVSSVAKQLHQVEVVNATSSEIIVMLRSKKTSSFRLKPPCDVRISAKNSHHFKFNLRSKSTGPIDDRWTMKSREGDLNAEFCLKAHIQRLALEIGATEIDFGAMVVKGEPKTKEIQVSNFTDLPVLVKSQLQHLSSCLDVEISPKGIVIGPRDSHNFSITLDPGDDEESIDGRIVFGAVKYFTEVKFKTQIIAPKFKLDGYFYYSGDKIYTLPDKRPGQTSTGTLTIRNTGTVPFDYSCSLREKSPLIVAPISSRVSVGMSKDLRLSMRSPTINQISEDVQITVEGCPTETLRVEGQWMHSKLKFEKEQVNFEVNRAHIAKMLVDEKTSITLEGHNLLCNESNWTATVYAPRSERFTFDQDSYQVKGGEYAVVCMTWEITRVKHQSHQIVFVTDTNEEISFSVDMVIPNMPPLSIKPPNCFLATKPGEKIKKPVDVQSSTPFKIQWEAVQTECISSAVVKARSKALSKTSPAEEEKEWPLSVADMPESFNPAEQILSIELEAGKQTSGWVFVDLLFTSEHWILISERLADSQPLMTKQGIAIRVNEKRSMFEEMLNESCDVGQDRGNEDGKICLPDLDVLNALSCTENQSSSAQTLLLLMLTELASLLPDWQLTEKKMLSIVNSHSPETASKLCAEYADDLNGLPDAIDDKLQSFSDYFSTLRVKFEEDGIKALPSVHVHPRALIKASQKTQLLARAQYVLFHADCEEHQRWPIMVASLRSVAGGGINATLFDDVVQKASSILKRDEFSFGSLIQEMREMLKIEEESDMEGLELLSQLPQLLGNGIEKSDVIEIMLRTIPNSASEEYLLSSALSKIPDTDLLFTSVITSSWVDPAQNLCSTDPKQIFLGFCSALVRLESESQDIIVDCIIQEFKAEFTKPTSRSSHKKSRLEDSVERSITKIIRILRPNNLSDPIMALKKGPTKEQTKLRHLREITIETLFIILRTQKDCDLKKPDSVKSAFIKISKGFPDQNGRTKTCKERALNEMFNKNQMKKAVELVDAWRTSSIDTTDIKSLLKPILAIIFFLMPQLEQDSLKAKLTHSIDALKPFSIDYNISGYALVSRIIHYVSILLGKESEYSEMVDGFENLRRQSIIKDVVNFCRSISSKTSASEIFEKVFGNENHPMDPETTLKLLLPQEKLESVTRVIQSLSQPNIKITEDQKTIFEEICNINFKKDYDMVRDLSKVVQQLKKIENGSVLTTERLLAVRKLAMAISGSAKWSQASPKSQSILDIVFSLSAAYLCKDMTPETASMSKMILLLSLTAYFNKGLHNKKVCRVNMGEDGLEFKRPEIPDYNPTEEDDAPSDMMTAESQEETECESAVPIETSEDNRDSKQSQWLPPKAKAQPQQTDVPKAEASDSKRDNKQMSRWLWWGRDEDEEVRREEFKHLEKGLRDAKSKIKCLFICAESTKGKEKSMGLSFDEIRHLSVNLVELSENWCLMFEAVVKQLPAVGSKRDSRIIRNGIQIISLSECLEEYMCSCTLLTVPTAISSIRHSILQNLDAIPRDMVSQKLKELLDDVGATAFVKGITTEDFQMPSANYNSSQSRGTDKERPGTWTSDVSNSHQAVPHGDGELEYLSKPNYQKEDDTKNLIQAAETHQENYDRTRKQNASVRSVIFHACGNLLMNNDVEEDESSDEEPNLGAVEHQAPPPSLKLSGRISASGSSRRSFKIDGFRNRDGCDVISAAAENDSMETVKAKFDIDVSMTHQQMEKADLDKIYKGTSTTRPDVRRRPAKDVEYMTPKHDQWTYNLLIQCKPFVKFLATVLQRFQRHFHKFYEAVIEKHTFEWCILVDNSGSMFTKRHEMIEALVLIMETLVRMEHQFAVARFGDRNSQHILKSMQQPFSDLIGQKIIESFSYDQGTYPASAVANVAEKIWPNDLAEQQRFQAHRVMLMIVDGLTQEKNPYDYVSVCNEKSFDLVVLNIKDQKQSSVMDQIDKLWSQAAIFHVVMDKDNVELLPKLVPDLMLQEIDKIRQSVITRRASSALESPVPVKTSKIFTDFLAEKDKSNGQAISKAAIDLCTDLGKRSLPKLPAELKREDMYECAGQSYIVPFQAESSRLTQRVKETEDSMEMTLESLLEQMTEYQSNGMNYENFRKAEMAWVAAEERCSWDISRVAEALESYFPSNVFKRTKADVQGPSIYLPGFIKHLATKGNEKKIFASKKGGGKAEYALVILLDISSSMMYGSKRIGVLETLLLIIGALQQLNIENFSIVLFAEGIYPIKLAETPWDSASILLLLETTVRNQEQSTMDADAVLFARDILETGQTRGSKKIFIITDGFGSTGVRLASALNKAAESGIDVLAIGVGQEEFFLKHCYGNWITAAFPQYLPDAIAKLVDRTTTVDQYQMMSQRRAIDWLSMALLPEGSAEQLEDVFLIKNPVFPDLLKAMRTDREAKLATDNKSNTFTVDICFALDCSGSMSPYFATVKQQIRIVANGIQEKIEEHHPGINISFRFGAVAYKDYEDPGHLTVCQFTSDTEALKRFLSRRKASGGSDMPDDVLGGLNAVAEMGGWGGRVRICVLIGDSPGHGSDLNDCDDDRYPDGDPNGLIVRDVMTKLKDKEIHLMFCKISNDTDKTIRQLASKYNDRTKFELVSQNIFGCGDRAVWASYHFIFCLDKSRSMKGKPQKDLNEAFHAFLEKRVKDQSYNDYVTVIQFDDEIHVTHDNVPLDVNLGLCQESKFGTRFLPALQKAEETLNNNERNDPKTPVLVLMSDGGSGDSEEQIINRMTAMSTEYTRLQVHTIGFGLGNRHELLQAIAHMTHGKYHRARDRVELSVAFSNIATTSSATDVIATQFEKMINDMVASSIILCHL